ncbi:MAG: hypothetical protein V5B30_09425 [Candidatus Accumulibacter delftensis]|jgi:hypothetical protein
MKKKLAAAAICAAFAAAPTHAAVVWSFDYTDAAGVGFNHLTDGTVRQNELQSAANYVSSFLTSYSTTLYMTVDGSGSTPGNLASAGSNYNASNPGPGFGDQGDVMRKILGGDAADRITGRRPSVDQGRPEHGGCRGASRAHRLRRAHRDAAHHVSPLGSPTHPSDRLAVFCAGHPGRTLSAGRGFPAGPLPVMATKSQAR